jgi:hypothetical protein
MVKTNGRLSEMEKFCEHVNAEIIQNNSILKKLDEERIAHSETRAYLKTVKEQPCNDADQHSLEISKIESEMTVVCEANLFLDSQVNKLKVNTDKAEHKVKSIERQLKCEITAHLETKDEIAFLQAKVKELESQLLEKITNLDAI